MDVPGDLALLGCGERGTWPCEAAARGPLFDEGRGGFGEGASAFCISRRPLWGVLSAAAAVANAPPKQPTWRVPPAGGTLTLALPELTEDGLGRVEPGAGMTSLRLFSGVPPLCFLSGVPVRELSAALVGGGTLEARFPLSVAGSPSGLQSSAPLRQGRQHTFAVYQQVVSWWHDLMAWDYEQVICHHALPLRVVAVKQGGYLGCYAMVICLASMPKPKVVAECGQQWKPRAPLDCPKACQ